MNTVTRHACKHLSLNSAFILNRYVTTCPRRPQPGEDDHNDNDWSDEDQWTGTTAGITKGTGTTTTTATATMERQRRRNGSDNDDGE